jgi:hypothetical protein
LAHCFLIQALKHRVVGLDLFHEHTVAGLGLFRLIFERQMAQKYVQHIRLLLEKGAFAQSMDGHLGAFVEFLAFSLRAVDQAEKVILMYLKKVLGLSLSCAFNEDAKPVGQGLIHFGILLGFK